MEPLNPLALDWFDSVKEKGRANKQENKTHKNHDVAGRSWWGNGAEFMIAMCVDGNCKSNGSRIYAVIKVVCGGACVTAT